TRSAGVAVVARSCVVRVDAARAGVAGVVGAGVGVVAVRRRSADAGAGGARVARCAGIAVVAGNGVVRVDAARAGVAGVVGAGVVVVAIRRGSAAAGAAGAGVVRGAGVAVVAGGGVVGVNATRARIAGVVGARVGVVAVDHRPGA